ncbi:MAG TPA: UPF0182 family protein [Nitrospirae bacterium]|nr:UPF0182 family protein [Nitrospirota bacterium]
MKRNIFFILGITVVLLILASLLTSVGFYVDYLFFKEVGLVSVFQKTFLTQVVSGGVFFVVALIIYTVNILICNSRDFPQGRLYQLEKNLYVLRKYDLNDIVKKASLLVGIFISIFFGLNGSRYWNEILLFTNSIKAGINDPVFGRDISFYIFRYPLLNSLNRVGSLFIFILIITTVANYALRGGITYIEGLFSIDRRVRLHTTLLISLLILNIAFRFYLDRFDLLFSRHEILYGASYTDVKARLLAYNAVVVLCLLTSVSIFYGIYRRHKLALLAPPAALLIVYVVGVGIYPSLLQSFKVTPNEIVLEKPYIERHIAFTRIGYDLNKIRIQPFNPGKGLTAGDIEKNISTIRNIRLWDEEPLLKTYSQLQQIRTYYKFNDVDTDRYRINGKYMQVMLSPRELSYEDLPGKTWINERLVYTHGIGLTMGTVSGITEEGLPQFILKDIPPVTVGDIKDIKITRPEIYYGESTNEYVVVNTKVREFGYPTKSGNVYTHYEGNGGVRLSNILKRTLYALHFGDFKLILSTDITGKSRIIYYRNIIERVSKIAPFMLYDQDPYMMISDDGKLYWIIDAYTYTNRLPYSEPISRGVNYIRNPVKVVVDAYDGTLSFYIVDDRDILIKTYRKIFPRLFKPYSKMPDDIKRHIRYPRTLMKVQSRMFATFHMTDPRVFYNKEDLWEIPVYKGKSMEPYYLILTLPKDTLKKGAKGKEEFVLLVPFTPAKRDNLAAWMAARCDGENYGDIIVYTFPRDRLVFGPRQIDARIDQNAYISQQLTLWGQRGSDVIRGSLLIIPIETSLIYVQPLYLVATDRVGLPELRRVIVAYENEVVMKKNLQSALYALFRARTEGMSLESMPAAAPPAAIEETALGRRALESFMKAKEALKKEDWPGFGRYLKETERLLRKLAGKERK